MYKQIFQKKVKSDILWSRISAEAEQPAVLQWTFLAHAFHFLTTLIILSNVHGNVLPISKQFL